MPKGTLNNVTKIPKPKKAARPPLANPPPPAKAPPQQPAYRVPDELAKIMEKRKIYTDLRIGYLSKNFAYRNALRSTRKMMKYSKQFSAKIVDLYPELAGKQLNYDELTKTVTILR